ncbi:uncharacterized protein LOC107780729 [Nicotiana tabacum]|uniref:Uncharacterized protein LOC107780729 n=1 Tax=Nicotiana tabacum TaxID=4097 RepID=A0A1S3YXC0_TOBAC
MSDDFDSHAVSASKEPLSVSSNTKGHQLQTDSLSFTEKAISDKTSIDDIGWNLNMGASEVKDKTLVPKVTDFVTQSGILAGESIKKEEDKGSIEENLLGSKDDGTVRCSLKIEVIDDTAMFDISQVGKSCTVDKRLRGFDGKSASNRKKKNAIHQVEKENGEKMVARKAKLSNMEEAKEKNLRKGGGEEKRVYCRKELEILRFIGMEEQRKKWTEVYIGLDDTVQKEYDGLVDSYTQKHIRRPRRHLGKENTPVISGNDHSEHLHDQECNVNEESDDSDDDYSSIQRPAFIVTGEPDFDSGPPEDGLEYLRRVRWEASLLPKVKVAKVEGSRLNKEQTYYMPQIPDIASCLEHLLPLKEWEEAFLADFSELRQALSRLPANIGTSSQLHSATFVDQEHSSNQLPEGIILDKFDGLMPGEDESYLCDAGDDSALGNSIPMSSLAEKFVNGPTVSVILQMDAVARVTMLRKRITAVQSMTTLSRDDCLWLFALCTAVDTPLDADTCAALRSLLRKCATLRADKSKLDDEVIMLNMLITISGSYFGQSEQ